MTITNTLMHLAELHHAYGLIGLSEYRERIEVALWLGEDGMMDPRLAGEEPPDAGGVPEPEELPNYEVIVRPRNHPSGSAAHLEPDDDLELIFMAWRFTGADQDPFPSVPHGHLDSANRPWPKLNPYTGWAFKDPRNEEKSRNLSKKQMVLLWSDKRFRSFCRERVVWYMETFPKYRFPVSNPLRMPRYR